MAGLKFIGWTQNERESEQFGNHTLDRRLYLNAEGKVVEEGDPSAAFLLGGKGAEIPMREAVQLGLVSKDEAATKVADKLDDKKGAKPADKAVRKADNKGR